MAAKAPKKAPEARCVDCRWCRAATVGCFGAKYVCGLDGVRFSWIEAQRRPCERFLPKTYGD